MFNKNFAYGLVLALPLLGLAAYTQVPVKPTTLTVYNVMDFGAVSDGDVTKAKANAAAFNGATVAASNPSSPGVVYVPSTTKGFIISNGTWKVPTNNLVIRGEASMGSNPIWGATSLIIGTGPGNTLEIGGGGCNIKNLVFKSNASGEQKGSDAFLLITNTQVSVSDLYMNSPNIGISLQLPSGANGEFWLKDIEMEGGFAYAGIVVNVGNAAVRINHTIMNNWFGPQPSYGILVQSAGEFIMDGGCDIMQMGNCLALVPGLGGVKNQYVSAIKISDCLFDSANGLGCVYIAPQSNGFVITARFTSVWASKNGNAAGIVTNGFTLDGTQTVGSPQVPIQDITFVNCEGKSFTNHCGLYAKGVQALTISNCTFGDNYMGVWLANGCSDVIVTGNKVGNYAPAIQGQVNGGNADHGIFIEPSVTRFIVAENLGYGNGKGNVLSLALPGAGVIGINLP